MSIIPSKRFYVYTLNYPSLNGSDGLPFYVGKGSGRRAEIHLIEARNPDCYCKKCRTIRLIWAMGHEVVIHYVYETDDPRAALSYESELTRELGPGGRLCNKQNNPYSRYSPPSIPVYQMSYEQYACFLKKQKLSRKEREQILEEWVHRKLDGLKKDWRTARRQRWDEEAEQLAAEIDELRMQAGLAWQGMFPFGKY